MKPHGRMMVLAAAGPFATLLCMPRAGSGQLEYDVLGLSDAERELLSQPSSGSTIDTGFERPPWCPGFFCGVALPQCDSAGGTQPAVPGS